MLTMQSLREGCVVSRYDEFEQMLRYLKTLDRVNAKILEGIGKYGPRNISFFAGSIGLPTSTVAFRIKKLIEKTKRLWICTDLNHSKLGLIKAIIIAEALPGDWEKLWKVMENLRYLVYLVRCYGKIYGCYAIYSFPEEYKRKLVEYLDEAKRLKALSNYLLFWTNEKCEVVPNFVWFDFKNKRWVFHWQQWVEEISNAPGRLSEHLIDIEDYSILADEIDLHILEKLEEDATIELTRLAEAVGITPRSVSYRYHKHILERGLILDYDVEIFPYPYMASEMCAFIIHFEDERALAKFTNTLHNKPFVLSYLKVVGQNSLVVHTYTPKTEFPGLIESLNKLVKKRVVKSFFHVSFILTPYKSKTISPEFFKNGAWQYDHEYILETLRKIASE